MSIKFLVLGGVFWVLGGGGGGGSADFIFMGARIFSEVANLGFRAGRPAGGSLSSPLPLMLLFALPSLAAPCRGRAPSSVPPG